MMITTAIASISTVRNIVTLFFGKNSQYPFRYQLESIYLHWGPTSKQETKDDGRDGLDVRASAGGGSEHSVAGRFYPAEVQLMAFNADLFSNLTEAMGRPNGVVGVAVMVQEEARKVNPALRTMIQHLRKVLLE